MKKPRKVFECAKWLSAKEYSHFPTYARVAFLGTLRKFSFTSSRKLSKCLCSTFNYACWVRFKQKRTTDILVLGHPNPLNIYALDTWPVKMGPTVVSETSSTNLTHAPCKTPKPKYRYSSHGESLKSRKKRTNWKENVIKHALQYNLIRNCKRYKKSPMRTFLPFFKFATACKNFT